MITFATQEDFEKAVMQVLKDRLNVKVVVTKGYSDWEGNSTGVLVTLSELAGEDIDSDSDYA